MEPHLSGAILQNVERVEPHYQLASNPQVGGHKKSLASHPTLLDSPVAGGLSVAWFVHYDCGEVAVVEEPCDPWALDDVGCLPVKVELADSSRIVSAWEKNGVLRVTLREP
jgi:hypothetical protein